MPLSPPTDWTLPDRTWILHTTPVAGVLTERWVDLQSRTARRYSSRLLALKTVAGVERKNHWLLAADRWDTKLAYRGMYKSAGFSPIWLAPYFRGNVAPLVVHAHFGQSAAQLVRFAGSVGRPLIASFYGFDATKKPYVESRLWRRRYRALFSSAAACVVEGPQMAERVASLGCPAEKIEVVRLPADEEGLVGIERQPASTFRVAVAGRFVEKKGFDTAIRAFGRAFGTDSDAELLIIGSGPLENHYREIARTTGVADRITWTGSLDFSTYMATIGTAHVALYPSRTASDGDSEGGAPVTLIEAQWLGVPSVVSRHDDLEFVSGPGAISLDARAVDEWSDALDFLAKNPGKLQEMSTLARAFVRERHSPLANVKRREEIYDTAQA